MYIYNMKKQLILGLWCTSALTAGAQSFTEWQKRK